MHASVDTQAARRGATMNMFERLFSYTDTVEFESNLTMDVLRERFTKALVGTRSSSEAPVFSAFLSGHVDGHKVFLHRGRFLFAEYLIKPIFYGTIDQRGAKTILKGSFKISKITRVTFLVGVLILLLVEAIFVLVVSGSNGQPLAKSLFVLFIPATLLTLSLVVLFLKRGFRSDIEWLTQEIQKTLESH
jgi:hypothetical protein